MKILLSAAAMSAALAFGAMGITTASAAPATQSQAVQEKNASTMTDVSARHRGRHHGHRHHFRHGPRYGYGPRYYAPRPAYGYGYGRPYGGYGYGGGPGISFSFGGGRW